MATLFRIQANSPRLGIHEVVESAIHRINLYPANNTIGIFNSYLLDSGVHVSGE